MVKIIFLLCSIRDKNSMNGFTPSPEVNNLLIKFRSHSHLCKNLMKPTFKIRIIFQSHICGCWCGRGKNWGNVTGKVSGKEVNVFLLDEKWSETRGYFFIFGSSFVPMKEKTTADHSSKWNIIWVEGKKEAIFFCKMEFS